MSDRRICKMCPNEIRMIVQTGTDYCSQNCWQADGSPDPTVNHSATVRRHRGTTASPTETRRASTYGG